MSFKLGYVLTHQEISVTVKEKLKDGSLGRSLSGQRDSGPEAPSSLAAKMEM